MTQCTPKQLEFHALGSRDIVGRFDGGEISSHGGGLLLREVDQRLGLFDRLAECFTDHRKQDLVEHDVRSLLAQRIFAIALGHEDLNDHDDLMRDTVLAAMVGKRDPSGNSRMRERDKGAALASSSTLNRLELGCPDDAADSRYQRIIGDTDAMDRLLVDWFLDSQDPPDEIWLDLDATDDRLHGNQEGRFYHGYYRSYCYLPLYIFCDEHLLCARLRTSDQDGAAGSLEEVQRIVAHIRERWPQTRIHIRADSGFCRDALLHWCEKNQVRYVIGLAKNDRLKSAITEELQSVKERCEATGQSVRDFKNLRYQTQTSWSRKRRVVAKVEHLPGKSNPRFVVTNIPSKQINAKQLYEDLYCARGEMENRIKEQQLDLFADRTSTATMRANQLRLYFSSFAYVLMHGLRWMGLSNTTLERAQCQSIRLKLLHVGTRVSVTVRKVWLAFSEAYPHQALFALVLKHLQAYPIWKPG